MNLYPFIRGSLERSFNELFFSDVFLSNQCKFIVFNIFWCRMLIISCKLLVITVKSNEKPNELNICKVMPKRLNI